MRHLLAACLASLVAGSCLADAAALRAGDVPAPIVVRGAEAIRSITLANGMKVIVWSDHDIPNVALYNWVRVGSRNEAPGITGIAHFFEHMMFNGTSRRAPGQFDRELEAQGGASNAFTSEDVTVYQDWVPRSGLELVFDLEGDRLANLAFDPKVVESEREVVYSERRARVEDDNGGLLMEQVQASAFVAHPYQIPTIGWPSDIRSWRMQDLQDFYRRNYAPNNCTLVLVGDVAPDEVFALARKYLEPIPRQEPPRAVTTTEPEQLGERRLVLERKAQTPLLQVAYKAPAAADPAAPAVNVLVSILAQGDASRLHRELVERQKVAIDVGGYWQEGFDPSLLWFMLTLPEGGDLAAAQKALDAQLAQVVDAGVTEAELRRAKNLAASGFWKSIATIDGKARMLGHYDVIRGDWQALFTAPAAWESVTREQVQAAAAEYLHSRRRTVGTLRSPVKP
jgi:zinc protease